MVAYGETGITVDNVLSDWEEVDLETEAIAVVAPDGRLAGYADIDKRGYTNVTVYGYVHPQHRGQGIGRYLVAWAERWTLDRLHLAPERARVNVQFHVLAQDEPARSLLESLGYELVRTHYMMAIELEQPPPNPEWPAGIVIRRFVPGQDERATYEAVTDAKRDHWGSEMLTFEDWLDRSRLAHRDPGLWFLAEDISNGVIAGTCLCQIVGDSGSIDWVGVRRGWRGKGVAFALLQHAFGELGRRGVRRITLSVDAESATGAPRLYLRAGMRVTKSYVLYRKVLRPGNARGS